MPGAGFDHPGRHRLESQPSSRTGENSPYGMIGGIEETSASFEARSAPRSYPTISEVARASQQHLPRSATDAREALLRNSDDNCIRLNHGLFLTVLRPYSCSCRY